MRALNSAVTGLRAHQTRMDVVGNNIANVNTVGFKSSRVTFQDVFSQTLAAGSATTNPKQVGLGVNVASIDMDMSSGSPNLTGRALDIAIEGDGMFILRQGDGSVVYTRVGSFDWNADGVLVNPGTGARVQGWAVDENGQVISGVLTDIVMPTGSTAPAQVTTQASLVGNLDPTAQPGTEVSTSLIIYDSLGRPHTVTLNFVRGMDPSDPEEWSVSAAGGDGTVAGAGSVTLTFDETTKAVSGGPWTITFTTADTGEDITVSIDLSGIRLGYSGAGVSNVTVQSADGAPMGTLESVTISPDGQVIGIYSNGARIVQAYIALANFTNPAGLSKVGDTTFTETMASGPAMIGLPNTAGRGRLVTGNLEASNVDLSTEFTDMILTQRGFQANARVVSTADDMLQELVNLRR